MIAFLQPNLYTVVPKWTAGPNQGVLLPHFCYVGQPRRTKPPHFEGSRLVTADHPAEVEGRPASQALELQFNST